MRKYLYVSLLKPLKAGQGENTIWDSLVVYILLQKFRWTPKAVLNSVLGDILSGLQPLLAPWEKFATARQLSALRSERHL